MKNEGTDWSAVETLVIQVMEDAAIQGLCRDGQIEVAIGRLRPLMPSLSTAELTTVIEELSRS